MIHPAGAGEHDLLVGRGIHFAADLVCQQFFDQVHLVPALGGAGFLDTAQIDFAVFVQHFAADQADGLALFALNGEFQIPGDILPKVQHVTGQQFGGKPFVLLHGHIVRGCDEHILRRGYFTRFSLIAWLHGVVIDFAVLQIGETDGPVVAPIPGVVRADRLNRSVRKRQFQLRQDAGLRSEHVGDAIGCHAAPEPPIRQAQFKGVFLLQQHRYIVGLILNPLAVIGHAGGQDESLDALAVDAHVVHAPGGGIQAGGHNLLLAGEGFAEVIHRIPLLLVGLVIAADPLCRPIREMQEAQLKPGGRRFTLLIVFIPQRNRPFDSFSAVQRLSAIKDMGHGGRFYLAAVPDGFILPLCDDLISGLSDSGLTIPGKTRRGNTQPQGLSQVFCLQANRFHGAASVHLIGMAAVAVSPPLAVTVTLPLLPARTTAMALP